jgi:hypothetical protein
MNTAGEVWGMLKRTIRKKPRTQRSIASGPQLQNRMQRNQGTGFYVYVNKKTYLKFLKDP